MEGGKANNFVSNSLNSGCFGFANDIWSTKTLSLRSKRLYNFKISNTVLYKNYMRECEVNTNIVRDKEGRRERIRVADSTYVGWRRR